MQKPFTISPEMEAELKDEIDRITANPNTFGAGVGKVSLPRRHAPVSDSEGAEAMQEHNPPVDPVNPPHYRKHPSGIECIEVTRHLNFNIGNAIKYLWRYMDKGDPVENLKKAQWYIDDEIKRLGGKI
jgi:hypothetical protein